MLPVFLQHLPPPVGVCGERNYGLFFSIFDPEGSVLWICNTPSWRLQSLLLCESGQGVRLFTQVLRIRKRSNRKVILGSLGLAGFRRPENGIPNYSHSTHFFHRNGRFPG